MPIKDLTGQKFCKLFVVKRVDNHRTKGGYSKVQYLCKCDCGNYVVVLADSLKSGNTKGCGCYNVEMHRTLNRTHGKSRTRIYRIWRSMKARCYDPNSSRYTSYGGRGITICDEWINDFEAFDEWSTSHGYSEKLSIDRIDVNGNYEPSNCRWATNDEQAVNKTNNHYLELNGEIKTVSEWARQLGVRYNLISNRLQRGWSVENALTIPLLKRGEKAC